MDSQFDDHDMTALAEAIARGDLSPREALECSLRRLDERNPTVNAVVSARAEQALAESMRVFRTARSGAFRS